MHGCMDALADKVQNKRSDPLADIVLHHTYTSSDIFHSINCYISNNGMQDKSFFKLLAYNIMFNRFILKISFKDQKDLQGWLNVAS